MTISDSPIETPAAAPMMPPPPTGESLTSQVSKGVLWLTIQALGTKAAMTLTNLALAYLLAKEDFGLIAKVYTVMAFASLAQQTGQREILIQRQRHFYRWVNAAFWLSVGTGVLGALVLAMAAPIAARVFHDARIIPMLLIVAAAAPLDAVAIVPTAKLQIDMRFRALGAVGILVAFGNMIGTIALAATGFGALSFVLLKPVASLATLVITWALARPQLHWRLQFRRWRYMMRDGGFIFGIAVMSVILSFGDNLVLALLCSDLALANYYFAYGLSTQAAQLVISNLQSALFPALSKMGNDPARQTAAYIRATRISGLVGSCLCGLVGLLAAPGLHICFGHKWDDAIPVLQVLSVMMTITCVFGPTGALFQAQGRFKIMFYYCVGVSVIFILAVVLGARLGQALGVAWSILIVNLFLNPVACYLAIKGGGGTWRDIGSMAWLPLLTNLVVFGPLIVLQSFAPRTAIVNASFIIVAPPVALVAYGLLVRVTARDLWNDLIARLQSWTKRFSPKARESANKKLAINYF